jgi:hypothetical protein
MNRLARGAPWCFRPVIQKNGAAIEAGSAAYATSPAFAAEIGVIGPASQNGSAASAPKPICTYSCRQVASGSAQRLTSTP